MTPRDALAILTKDLPESVVDALRILYPNRLPTEPTYTLRDIDILVGQQQIIDKLQAILDKRTRDAALNP